MNEYAGKPTVLGGAMAAILPPPNELHLAARLDQMQACVIETHKILDAIQDRGPEDDCDYEASIMGDTQRLGSDLSNLRDRCVRLAAVLGKRV